MTTARNSHRARFDFELALVLAGHSIEELTTMAVKEKSAWRRKIIENRIADAKNYAEWEQEATTEEARRALLEGNAEDAGDAVSRIAEECIMRARRGDYTLLDRIISAAYFSDEAVISGEFIRGADDPN